MKFTFASILNILFLLISFTVLAGGGFNQLYWTKPAFGAMAEEIISRC